MIYRELEAAVAPFGLICRGGFQLTEGDGFNHQGSLVLIGNAGSAFWQAFVAVSGSKSSDHPMDNWTQRIMDDVAMAFDATPYYPFVGPPYYPFQQWAMRSEPVHPSPTGPLIHPAYGLWHAYRAALVFEKTIEVPDLVSGTSPCQSCVDQPCLTACPVDALKPQHYNVPLCVDHLGSDPTPYCRNAGCQARHACPVGQSYAYQQDHARFHMNKFIESRPVMTD